MSIYKLPLPTDTWLVNKLIEQSTEGYLIIAKLHQKEKVIIKLSIDNNAEYKIMKLIEKQEYIPNIPKVYGVMSCYEKNINIKNHLKELVDKGLCNGKKDKDSTKIYFTIIERIKDHVRLDSLGNSILPREQIFSLLAQGLYTIYSLYYIFGILHNDYNEGNMLIQPCDKDMEIEYKFIHMPYRYFDFELGDESCNKSKTRHNIKSNGVKLYLIDYDQATCIHQKYQNVTKVTIDHHPIEHVWSYIKAICKYGSSDIYDICKHHYETRGKHLISYSQQFYDRYKNDPSQFNCYFLIDRTRVTLRMWMKELFKIFPDTKDTGYGEIC